MAETGVAPTESDESPGGTQVETCIKVESLTKTFDGGQIVAAEDIDLDIKSDEFVVFLGPSGCGKTTTLRCIAGLEEPDAGHVYIYSDDVTYAKPKDRDLAFVFQNIALFPHMSVRKNMRFGLDMKTDLGKREKNERVREAAEILGIEELLDRKPSELSGGQQQRVSLGRAMVMEPAAFLLDEPFSALDANLRDQMRVEIKKLQNRLETAMIFVTHDQEEAMTLGDKIIVLDGGRIQQIGTPQEIYNEPQNLFVAQFIGSPSANFFQCTIGRSDDRYVLEHEQFALPLADEQVGAVDLADGERVTLGVRPENTILSETEPGLFEAEIQVIEHHGDRDAVHILADGHEYKAVTRQDAFESTEQTVSVRFDTEKLLLFDESNERLL